MRVHNYFSSFTIDQKCRLHCDPTTLFTAPVPLPCACTGPVYIPLTEICHPQFTCPPIPRGLADRTSCLTFLSSLVSVWLRTLTRTHVAFPPTTRRLPRFRTIGTLSLYRSALSHFTPPSSGRGSPPCRVHCLSYSGRYKKPLMQFVVFPDIMARTMGASMCAARRVSM